jgi:riboflavin kinase/FMN adenylyltransferase
MGENHRFGYRATGSKEFLRSEESRNDISVFAVRLYSSESAAVSSTRIREFIQQSRMREAVRMLGHPYLVLASRVRGTQKGTQLGCPTLNFREPAKAKATPPPGVYAAELEYGDSRWRGALYFGNCPTFEDREYHFEFHALSPGEGFPPIDDEAAIWIHDFVREDRAFPDERSLAAQMEEDVNSIRGFFKDQE